MTAEKLSAPEWAVIVEQTLADHPDWAAVTVADLQHGLLEALERQQDRVSKLSWGLHQALSSTRKSKRRKREMIVEAIRASNLHPTVWSAAAIERETRCLDDKSTK